MKDNQDQDAQAETHNTPCLEQDTPPEVAVSFVSNSEGCIAHLYDSVFISALLSGYVSFLIMLSAHHELSVWVYKCQLIDALWPFCRRAFQSEEVFTLV